MPFTARSTRMVLGALFVVTGFVALVAEQVFEKLLGLLLGTSTPSAAVVLAAYFLGLTLGAWGYARWLRPAIRNPIRAYAALEGTVALWCALWALSFDRLLPLFAAVLRPGADSLWLLSVLRFAVACLWILPPTLVMGATFPAVADALESVRSPDGRRSLARFYSANLLGALAASIAAPYLVFPRLGMGGALLVACALDLSVALAALLLSRSAPERPAIAEGAPAGTVPRVGALLLALAVVSGFLFFALEVLWTHLIGCVLGNSVYAFAAMLAVVLAGLFLGSVAMALVSRSGRPISSAAPAAFFLAGALALALTHGLWPAAPHALATRGAGITTFAAGELLRLLHAALLMLLPATVLGMAYPALFRTDLFPEASWAAVAGRMGAANTIGCVAGALASAFVLIPSLGSEASLRAVTALYALAGLGVGLLALRGRRRLVLLGSASAVLAAGALLPPWDQLALTSGEQVYFHRAFVGPGTRLLSFHEDAAGGITTVVESGTGPGRTRTLLTNGKFQGNDAGETSAQAGFAIAPALSVARLERALVIGLGTGQTLRVVTTLGFARRDVVEIAPGIVRAAEERFPHLLAGSLRAPGTRLFLEDGRNFLLLHDRERYDLVTMEISSVWFAGSTNLYSREFYELVRSRLREGGVFQQWIQLHHLGISELSSVIATLHAVFPNVGVWVIGGQGILVASDGPQLLGSAGALALVEHARDLWRSEEVEARLRDLLACRVLAPEDTARFVRHVAARVNTDRNRWLEFATPRYNLSDLPWDALNVATLVAFASPPAFRADAGVPPALAGAAASVTTEDRLRVLGARPELVERVRRSIARSARPAR